MHWIKTIDQEGMVTFSVISGYHLRKRLKKMGFRFDGRAKKWTYTISPEHKSRISQIEDVLKAAESRNEGLRFPYTVRG